MEKKCAFPVAYLMRWIVHRHCIRPILSKRTTDHQLYTFQVGAISQFIGNSLIHRRAAIWLITISDIDTERTLLIPLSKSVLQFCKLIHSDDDLVLLSKVGSLTELNKLWIINRNQYDYIVLIGHGNKTGYYFATDEWVDSHTLRQTLEMPNTTPKIFISLCCQTGKHPFAGNFSRSPVCKSYIAPFHSIHGAIASQFFQTYLIDHILGGKTSKTSFNNARKCVPGSSKFRYWENGVLKGGPK